MLPKYNKFVQSTTRCVWMHPIASINCIHDVFCYLHSYLYGPHCYTEEVSKLRDLKYFFFYWINEQINLKIILFCLALRVTNYNSSTFLMKIKMDFFTVLLIYFLVIIDTFIIATTNIARLNWINERKFS